MKNAAWRRLIIVLPISCLLASGTFAQNAQGSKAAPAKNDDPTAMKPESGTAPSIAPLGVGTAFNASLREPLDAHKNKAGDTVTAETTEDVVYQRSVIFPKGTKIVGHVVRASTQRSADASSALFVEFDKAILASGEEVVMNAGIQALAVGPIAKSKTAAPSTGDAPLHPEKGLDEDSGIGPGAIEAVGVSPSVVPATYQNSFASPRSSQRYTPPPTVFEGEFSKDGKLTPDSRGAYGRKNLGVYTPTSPGSHGTVLLSAGKVVHLDAGTRLLIVVQPPPDEVPVP